MDNKKKKQELSKRSYLFIIVLFLAIVAGGAYLYFKQPDISADNSPIETVQTQPTAQTNDDYLDFNFSRLNKNYLFSAKIPKTWRGEMTKKDEGINVFNPDSIETNSIDKSQIYVGAKQALDFSDPVGFNVLSSRDLKINEQSAKEYQVTLKNQPTASANQPSWRVQNHSVTVVKVPVGRTFWFYSFVKRPDLPDEVFQKFLKSLNFKPSDQPTESMVVKPIKYYPEEITLKRFGDLIKPETSPVQPEKFSGYHTGVDIEVLKINEEIPVYAITDGEVVRSNTAGGYGGIMTIKHKIGDKTLFVIYGHLKPSSQLPVKSQVVTGQEIAVLGDDKSAETDSERKHLHFGIYKGTTPDIAGYVKNESQLKNWLNPLDIVK